ncbi:thioesterase family protein [Methanolobus vulcani]|uniref:Acyl-CoA thioesterase n=1 Tax=Methanolobus vulcani TaxID=38026 RepID=A0A7Z8KMY1_9EURY|nr:thioesterase family protein [Methanolobus vulcani]TQD25088.1 acyl-CoA thioesterase [Methanolobus vulcani]
MFKATETPGFGEINGMKNANNYAIATWFEKARNPIFRFFIPDLDLSYEKWNLIMARIEYDYVGKIFYGKDVEIVTYISRIGNSSFIITQDAFQNGKKAAICKSTIVHYDFINKKSLLIPDDIRKCLEEHLISC